MTLIEHIIRQGVSEVAAQELADRKQRNPRLVMAEYRGRPINLCVPTAEDGLRFDQMIKNGVPPQSKTDKEFMAGTENGRQFQNNPWAGDAYKAVCEARGGTVKGKKYIASLARFPGDEEAFVSGRGDVQRICEQRGIGCEGAVNVAPRPKDGPAPPKVDVAPDILFDAVAREVVGKDLSKREIADTTERVRKRLKGNRK